MFTRVNTDGRAADVAPLARLIPGPDAHRRRFLARMPSSARRALLTAAIGLFAPGMAGAQADTAEAVSVNRRPNDKIPFAPFVKPSHLWIAWPKSDAYYEGDIGIPLFLWSRTGDLANPDSGEGANPRDCVVNRINLSPYRDTGSRKNRTGCTLTFVPRFVVRQLRSESAPVRTPTFNPGFEFNWHTLSVDTVGHLPPPGRFGRLRTIHIRLAHYSNGQSGCLFTNQEPNPQPGLCGDGTEGPEAINTTDGSFSTNYADVGATYVWIRFNDGLERLTHGPSVVLRAHIPGIAGSLGPEQAATYGRWGVLGSYMVRVRTTAGLQPTIAATPEIECAMGRAEGYEACRGSLNASLSFAELYGFGFSAKYAWGWDYYNVGYGRSLSGFTFGVMFDHTRALAITDAARSRIARTEKPD